MLWMIFLLMVGLQASLSLTLSAMTAMSAHTVGRQASKRRLTWMNISFGLGSSFITFLILATISLGWYDAFAKITWLEKLVNSSNFWFEISLILLAQSLIMFGLKIKNPDNQNPWQLPTLKTFLFKRSQKTKSVVEAFSLGIMTVLANSWLMLVNWMIFSLWAVKIDLILLTGFSLLTSLPIFVIALIINKQKIAKLHAFVIKSRDFWHYLNLICLILITFVIFIDAFYDIIN